MLDPELLKLLCCPETKQPVSLGDAESVAQLNEAIAAGLVKNRAGVVVTEPVEGALVREDGAVIYLVREDIPLMIVEEGVALPLQ
jgi:uncharacterized protein YbaR (Trm112 family)